ncbi:MAG: hypothetical protein ACLTXH_05945 [Enterobacter hormaechei]
MTNLQDGVVYRQTWLPLVNPLRKGRRSRCWGWWCLSGSGSLLSGIACAVRPWPTVALMALGFWWLNGALLRALA